MSEGGMRPRTFVDRVFWLAGAFLMLAMTGTMLYVVAARYFFNRPPLWSEDVPRTLFVWMVFEALMHVLVLAMIGVLSWFTVPLLRLKWGTTMLSTGWSEAVLVIPMIGGLGIAAIYQARRLLAVLRAMRTGEDVRDAQQAGAGMG
jgi:TRAP-type C4-dicarboxylate transport system permease small subunit